jgi:hypothetical protein
VWSLAGWLIEDFETKKLFGVRRSFLARAGAGATCKQLFRLRRLTSGLG